MSVLLVRHYHEKVHHQGRQITHAALRQGGYWLIGAHRLVSKELNNCVICRKLRGAHLNQRMADLPADRTEEVPPFTNVGFDVFGPWHVYIDQENERRWGKIRGVLDGMFAELGHHQLTHEFLTTLMSEVTAIVNARPIANIPTDTDDPQPLSPHTILTMKTRPLGPPSGEFLPPPICTLGAAGERSNT